MASAVIAITSSTIDIPNRRTVDLSLIKSSSSRILIVTTVLVIDIANAKNRESKNEKSNSEWATKNTINKVPIDSGNATMTEILPIDLSLAIGNSVPITKSSIIIPNSAKLFNESTLCIKLKGGV